MPVITMIGPHAVGKTTAARRYAKRYSGLRVAVADNQLEIRGGQKCASERGNPRSPRSRR